MSTSPLAHRSLPLPTRRIGGVQWPPLSPPSSTSASPSSASQPRSIPSYIPRAQSPTATRGSGQWTQMSPLSPGAGAGAGSNGGKVRARASMYDTPTAPSARSSLYDTPPPSHSSMYDTPPSTRSSLPRAQRTPSASARPRSVALPRTGPLGVHARGSSESLSSRRESGFVARQAAKFGGLSSNEIEEHETQALGHPRSTNTAKRNPRASMYADNRRSSIPMATFTSPKSISSPLASDASEASASEDERHVLGRAAPSSPRALPSRIPAPARSPTPVRGPTPAGSRIPSRTPSRAGQYTRAVHERSPSVRTPSLTARRLSDVHEVCLPGESLVAPSQDVASIEAGVADRAPSPDLSPDRSSSPPPSSAQLSDNTEHASSVESAHDLPRAPSQASQHTCTSEPSEEALRTPSQSTQELPNTGEQPYSPPHPPSPLVNEAQDFLARVRAQVASRKERGHGPAEQDARASDGELEHELTEDEYATPPSGASALQLELDADDNDLHFTPLQMCSRFDGQHEYLRAQIVEYKSDFATSQERMTTASDRLDDLERVETSTLDKLNALEKRRGEQETRRMKLEAAVAALEARSAKVRRWQETSGRHIGKEQRV